MRAASDKITPTPLSELAEQAALPTDHLYLLSGGVSRKVLVSGVNPVLALEDMSFTYNSDGNVSTISFADTGRVLTMSYNPDETMDTIVDNGLGAYPVHTRTFSYDDAGNVSGSVIS